MHFSIFQERAMIQYGQVMECSDTICGSNKLYIPNSCTQ